MRAITVMVGGASAFDEGQCGGRWTEYETRAITARASEDEYTIRVSVERQKRPH